MFTRIRCLFFLFVFFSHFGYSQSDTTIFYKANNKPALNKKDAIRCIKLRKKRKQVYCIKTYDKIDGVWRQSKSTQDLKIENNFLVKIRVNEGHFKTHILRQYVRKGNYYHIRDFDLDKNLLTEGLSRSILLPDWEGEVKAYFKSGQLMSISQYKNNQLLSNEIRLSCGKLIFEDVFETADVMPKFEQEKSDLANYLADSVKFPEFAKENKIKGSVVVKFIVDEKGQVLGEHIQESDHSTLEDEALRVVRNMPQWSPAILDGKAVKVAHSLAISFND